MTPLWLTMYGVVLLWWYVIREGAGSADCTGEVLLMYGRRYA
jgi:hypothetical protein